MKKLVILGLLALMLGLGGCGGSDAATSTTVMAMDTVMELTAYGAEGEAALTAAEAEIARLDALWSRHGEESALAQLNAEKQLAADVDTLALVKRAQTLSAETGGLFACTIAPVVVAWGFGDETQQVPDAATLAQLLTSVDDSRIVIADGQITLPQDASIDLGGIAKGYTAERVLAIFAEHGVTSGIVSLGGNVQALGAKPDGSLWRVGIQDPWNEGAHIAVIEVADRAVVTSGGYQRYFEENGVRYHHIIDPRTGYPAASGLASVTIVSADGTLADGLSTALYVMGLEDGLTWWRVHREDFDVLFVGEDGSVTITAGLANCCTLTDGSTPTIVY